ncbi:MAG: HAMP domain-containing protein [Alphaproteobacteria bacterium]|nr:HAMP domain-containing protein [Alphaproteobacteria bacterium]
MKLGFVRLPNLDWIPTRLSVGHKVAGFATLSTVVILVLSASINIYEARSLVDRQLVAALKSAEASFATKVEDRSKRALTAASIVAGMPSVQKALASQDRAALSAEFVPQFGVLKEQFDVQQMQFHLPPATSFLRVHRPDRFGDDLREIRPGVVEVNTSNRPVSGLEIGREGLGLRGIFPVSSGGRHVGSVEFGLAFDEALYQLFKRQSGIEAALYLADGDRLTYFAASTTSFKDLDVATIADGLKGARIIDRIVLDGRPHALIASPVQDFAKRTIGVSVKAIDRSEFDASLLHAWQASGVLAGIVFVLALLTIWIMSRTIGRPLSIMAYVMQRMSIGDLSQNYEPTGRGDEIGDLEKVLKRFRKTIKANREMTAEQKVMMGRQTEMLKRLSETAERV